MKRISALLNAVLIVLIVTVASGNPIPLTFFSELKFGPAGWVLEMKTPIEMSLDGWSLTSRSGSVLFKAGIAIGPRYLLFTADSLQSPLFINPVGDSITVCWQSHAYETLMFGPSASIAAPRPGQSLCRYRSFYYLDNSPTMGADNDTANAMGTIDGVAFNTKGVPQVGVFVVYRTDEEMTGVAMSDENGRFRITGRATAKLLTASKDGFPVQQAYVQMQPDSTVSISFNMDLMGTGDNDGAAIPRMCELAEPFPNPFNAGTTIEYSIPQRLSVRLTVVTVDGKEVATLRDAVDDAGNHRVAWDASGMSSGVYVVRLQAGGMVAQKKCVLIR